MSISLYARARAGTTVSQFHRLPERRRLFCGVRTLLALLFVAAGGSVWAMDSAELELDHALTFDFKTPHTVWARPWVRGKTRVLFIVNGRGTLPRECVELMERFDFEAKAVFWARIVDSTREHWHGGALGERRLLNLLDQPWDCFVFLLHGMKKMSPEQQVKLLQQVVVRGAGLVMVGVKDKRVFKPKNRLAPVPDFLARGGPAGAFRIGKGRGVLLPRRPEIGYYEGWQTDYDYWAERFGRAILWAAGKTPEAAVRITPSADPVDWNDLGASLAFQVSGKLPAGGAVLRVRLRAGARAPLTFPPRPVEAGATVRFPLPLLPADAWHIDAWLTAPGDGTIYAWNSRPLTVRSPRTVRSVTVDPDWSEIGGTLRGRAALAGPAMPDETVVVRLMDRRRRVLMRQAFRGGRNAVDFQFPVPAWFPMLVTVDARVYSAGREMHRAYCYFHVTQRHRGRFNFLIWDVPSGTLAPYAEQSLAEHGVTLQLSGRPEPPLYAAAYDIAWVPYTTRIVNRLGADGLMRPFCWNDAAAADAFARKLAQKYLPARRHGIFVWSLGDEVSTQGYCASPYCAEAYRRYLRQAYGSLAALNAAWGSHFKTWSEVGIRSKKDLDENWALRARNYPRWLDRRMFKSWNFVQFCRRFRKAYEAVDPKAKVGFEGAGRFDRGDDLDLIIRNNTFWSPYPGTVDEVIRSVAPRDFPRANWMGYTKDADSLLAKYWRMVTRGMDAVWWWRWDCIGRFHGWLAPDLRPYPAVKEILADTRFMRLGLGDLLLKCRLQDDETAMLYSYPSSLICKQENGAAFGGFESAHVHAQKIVWEQGLEFRYITDRMLRRGEARLARYKVLILPRAEALSDAAAARIRAFVENGGLLIADCRTGIFNEHGKLRTTGALDALFGIRRTGRPAPRTLSAPGIGDVRADPGVQVERGAARFTVDHVPLWIENRVGKGRTVFLNFDFGTFPDPGAADTPEAPLSALAARFAAAGVRPRYPLTDAAGKRVRNVQTIRWQDGGVEIVSLFRVGGSAQPIEVQLPARRTVYDIRRHAVFRGVRSFRTELLPNRASFFAVLPGPSPAAVLRISQDSPVAGKVLQVTLQMPKARGLHACRIRAWIAGRPAPWLERNVLVGTAPVRFPAPIAYNDPAGPLRLEAVDVFTGKPAATVSTTILPAPAAIPGATGIR